MIPDHHQRGQVLRGWLPAFAVSAAGILWGGCSLERDYEILSRFFDGVPRPVTPEAASAQAAIPDGTTPPRTVSAHSAYRERRCSECHGEHVSFGVVARGFGELTQAVCRECHAEVSAGFHVHGPVAIGECLACHQPHYSSFPGLLVGDAQPLCLSCHGMEYPSATPGSPHADGSRTCLDCHDPHGGADPYFLRPSVTRAGDAATAE